MKSGNWYVWETHRVPHWMRFPADEVEVESFIWEIRILSPCHMGGVLGSRVYQLLLPQSTVVLASIYLAGTTESLGGKAGFAALVVEG